MSVLRERALTIQTPEGITISQPLAAPASRFLAWLVDAATQIGLALAIITTVNKLAGVVPGDLANAIAIITVFAIWLGYGMVLEWAWRGRTLGKKMFGLRVVDAEGMQLEPKQVVLRNLLRIVDGLPFFYLVGGAACFFSRQCQRVGDMAAGTVVLRNVAPLGADFDRLLGDKYNSLRDHPHLAARLRQRVPPAEARLALLALVRRPRLDPDRRVEVFARLAEHFRAVVPFPEHASQGVTDEQYVRNVADVLFQTREPRTAARRGQPAPPSAYAAEDPEESPVAPF